MRKARIALVLIVVVGAGLFVTYKVGGLRAIKNYTSSHQITKSSPKNSTANARPSLPPGIHQTAVSCDTKGICVAAPPAAPSDCSSSSVAGLVQVMSADEAKVMSGLSPPSNHLDPDSLTHARTIAGTGLSYSVLRVSYQAPEINTDKQGKWATVKYLVLFQSNQGGTLHTFGYSRGLIAQCANNQWQALGQEDVGWN